MKTNLTMSLGKRNQVLLFLKILSIDVMIRPILYDRCETEVIGEQTREGLLTEGTSDNGTTVGLVD